MAKVKAILKTIFVFLAAVFGGVGIIIGLIYLGDLFYTYLGENLFWIPVVIILLSVVFIIVYKKVKVSTSENTSFNKNIKQTTKELLRGIGGFLLVIFILGLIKTSIAYSDSILKWIFNLFIVILYIVSSIFNYLFNNLLLVLLAIIALTLIAIYKKLR